MHEPTPKVFSKNAATHSKAQVVEQYALNFVELYFVTGYLEQSIRPETRIYRFVLAGDWIKKGGGEPSSSGSRGADAATMGLLEKGKVAKIKLK